MKLFLSGAAMVLCITCLAQVNNQPFLQKQSSVKISKPVQHKQGKKPYLQQLANGNTVILLPRDNMPCIIPRPEAYTPNRGNSLKNKNRVTPIPNPVKELSPITN
jgi:hypothetical protein